MPASVLENNDLHELASITLENVRKKLLDLTARNNLLNFKETAKTIRIVDELPNQVFDMLVKKGISMEILAYEPPAEDHENELADSEQPDEQGRGRDLLKTEVEDVEELHERYGLGADQVAFICSKIKKLGSIDAVKRLYDDSTNVSNFANGYANHLYKVEAETLESLGMASTRASVEYDSRKYGIESSRVLYIRGQVEMFGSVEAVGRSYPGERNSSKYAKDYAKHVFNSESTINSNCSEYDEDSNSININEELPVELADVANKHMDRFLQTPFISTQLEKKCISVARDYKSAINETGANLLYLAIGFVEWTQNDHSEKKFKAPLVLIPISIEKKRVNRPDKLYSFEVAFSTEYIETNLSLVEMLDKNFGIKLPEWGEGAKPENYFAEVAAAVSGERDWSIHREMVVGFFSFSKLRIYKDLDVDLWAKGCGPLDHDSVAELLVGRDQREQTGLEFGEDLDSSTQVDQIPLVMKADGSQLETIRDVLLGSGNMVVHGPPGTGKSQTIANIIGGALNQSKTVLFVSEKKAALDVVRKRLDSVNLGDFCLELHSHLTRKGQLHRDLERRLNKNYHEVQNYTQIIEERKHYRDRLLEYYDVLTLKRGRINKSAYEIFGEAERWRVKIGDIDVELEFENSLNFDETTINVVSEEIAEFSNLLADFRQDSFDAWNGFSPEVIFPGDEKKVSDILGAALNEITGILNQVNSAGIENDFSFAAISNLSNSNFENIPAMPVDWDQHVAPLLVENKNRECVHNLDSEITQYSCLTKDIVEHLGDIDDVASGFFEEAQGVAKELEGFGFGAWTIKDLKKLQEVAGQIGELFDSMVEAMSSIKPLFPGFINNRKYCAIVCDLSDYLDSLPPVIELHAYPNHASQLARQYLDEAKLTFRTYKKQLEVLSDSFSITKSPSIRRLREIAELFAEQPGLWGRCFSSAYKRAKKEYRNFLKKDNKTKAKDAVNQLSMLADVLEEVEKFEANENYTTILGPTFKGINTEWNKLHELVISARKIAKDLGTDASGKYFLNNFELHKGLIQRAAVDTRLNKRQLDALLNRFNSSAFNENVEFKQLSTMIDDFIPKVARLLPSLQRIGPNETATVTDIKAATGKVLDRVQIKNSIDQNPEYRNLLEDRFVGIDTDVDSLVSMNTWVDSIVDGKICDVGVLKWLLEVQTGERVSELKKISLDTQSYLSSFFKHMNTLESFGNVDREVWFNGGMSSCSLKQACCKFELAIENISSVQRWSAYQNLKGKLVERGLSSIVRGVEKKTISFQNASAVYKFAVFNSMARELIRESNVLRDFQGPVYEQIRAKLKQLEEDIERLAQNKIAWAASRHVPPKGISFGRVRDYTELSLIKHEIRKQRAHIPVRQLVKRSIGALKAIKPCFMMSPMSVAQYLAPGAVTFDLVIMDEASQLRLEDALGIVLRGRKTVVVGDSKQLPPTSFFDRNINIESDENTIADNAESILDVAQNCFPSSRLRWHYRSEDERLIAFSNAQFYEGELVVFPTPNTSRHDTGVFHHYIENSFSQKGKKGGVVNRQEASNVAEAIKKHFQRYGDLSLGVATFNVNQSELIQDEVDRLCREDKWLEDKIKKWDETPDSFFIKNLENVQGDERDVIFISTTYGPDKQSGQVYQRFGPINTDTGWRRLNVIITRAKKQVHVFTSLRASDIRIASGSRQGVVVLKNYLEFLETGKIPDWGSVNPDRGPDSSFEIAVAHALNQRGYKTKYQVGVAGFFVDIGVFHPVHEGEFVLGIECDGATYHSAKNVRDRDILRQSILESKGWNIHRVWSTDWFKSREAEIEKTLKVLERVVGATTGREKLSTTKDDLVEAYKPENVSEANSQDRETEELRKALLEFRKEKFESEYSDLDSTILSTTWIDRFVRRKPTTPDDFFMFPLEHREAIRGGSEYLGDILSLIEDFT